MKSKNKYHSFYAKTMALFIALIFLLSVPLVLVSNTILRITSYNVCYTKLLRCKEPTQLAQAVNTAVIPSIITMINSTLFSKTFAILSMTVSSHFCYKLAYQLFIFMQSNNYINPAYGCQYDALPMLLIIFHRRNEAKESTFMSTSCKQAHSQKPSCRMSMNFVRNALIKCVYVAFLPLKRVP